MDDSPTFTATTDANIPPPPPIVQESPAAASADPSQQLPPPVVSSTSGGGSRRGRGKIVAAILGILLLLGGVGAGLVLVRQQQDIREGATLCCEGGTCANGTPYGRDETAPQSSCGARSSEFCADKGGVGSGGGQCTGTTAPPPGGTTTCSAWTVTCANGQNFTEANCSTQATFAAVYGSTGEAGWKNEACGNAGSTVAGAEGCTSDADCPSGWVCQGAQGSRQCQNPGTADLCPGGACSGYYSFQCSTLSVSAESSGVPVCQQNGQRFSGESQAQSYATSGSTPNCGQVDKVCVGGNNDGKLCGGFTIYSSGCGGGTTAITPPAGTPPAGAALSAVCLDIKAYDTQGNPLTAQNLAGLSPGDIVRFAISGTTTSGTIDMARFTINGVLGQPTNLKIAGTNEFYTEYTVPPSVTQFSVKAELHHTDTGIAWF